MSGKQPLSYHLRKSSALRAALAVVAAAVLLFLMLFFSATSYKAPVISVIDPKIGNPGDTLVLYGENFGGAQDESYVEIGGLRLTSSAYVQWDDKRISVKLPENIRDGLVYVVTRGGRSEPKIFTNKSAVPVKVVADPTAAAPLVYNIEEKSQSVGGLVTINGKNFGLMRNNAKVFFSWQGGEAAQNSEYIACADADYEYWADGVIRVRVPDGASSGGMYVETEKGKSNNYPMSVKSAVGTKTFSEKRTYVAEVTLEVKEIVAEYGAGESAMVLRVPLPQTTASQRSVDVSESKPEPVIADMSGTMVHQFGERDFVDGIAASHSFVITTHAVKTAVNAASVSAYTALCKQRNAAYLAEDALVPAADSEVKALAAKIVGKAGNPYRAAKLVYDYMAENYAVEGELRAGDSPVLDLLESKSGDSYDFAMVYCALLRAAGVAAAPCAGVLVDSNMQAQPHWWCEFYLENFGWVPVDVALGAGLEYEGFSRAESARAFYFGNLDGQHITFSRGYNRLRPTIANSKIVFLPRAYALQSIWEESSENIKSYSSFWTSPKITGVY